MIGLRNGLQKKNENTNRNNNTASTPPCAKTYEKPFLLSFNALDLLVRKFIVLVWCHACSWSHSSCSHSSCRLFVSIYDCITVTCTLSWYDNDTKEFSVSSPSVEQDDICEEGQPCCWDLSTCAKCVWTELVLLNIHRISTVSITLSFYEFYAFPLWNSMRMYSPFTRMKQSLL